MEIICVTTSKTFPRAWGQLFPRAINKKIVFGLFGGSWVIQKYFQGQTWDISKGRQQRFPCADISIGLPLEILSVSEVRQKTPFYFWRPLLPLEKTKPADGKSENSSSENLTLSIIYFHKKWHLKIRIFHNLEEYNLIFQIEIQSN